MVGFARAKKGRYENVNDVEYADMSRMPAVFIGSSSEALPVARLIKQRLNTVAEVRLWNEEIFEPGLTAIESLERNFNKFEFGVFVFSGEDQVTIREHSLAAVRDNVIFELGLFMGLHGRNRTAIIYDAAKKPDVLSDLAGVTMVPFYLSGAYPELNQAIEKPSEAVATQILRLTPETWRTKWRMPSGEVCESLMLFVDGRRITGRRILSGSQQQVYIVSGYRATGCDTLSYSSEDGSGSGAIFLHHFGAGSAVGVLTYLDAWDTKTIVPLRNDWHLEIRGAN